jgi:hypothetical protein
MARFFRSVLTETNLTSSKGDEGVYRNKPINLDLVITYEASLENLDFTVKAGPPDHREPQLAITFLCAGNIEIAWFYANETDRSEDLDRLVDREDCT